MSTNKYLMAMVCGLALMAGAKEVTYTSTAGGAWSEATSWVDGIVPESGDTILIPGNARLTDADGATAALADQITIATNATLTVENEETITLAGFVSGDGRLVKQGAGLLDFTKAPTGTTAWGMTTVYRLAGGYVISNGTVRFPTHQGAAGVEWHTGPMTVSAPGVLDVAANCNFRMDNLSGDGTIINSRGYTTQLRPVGTSVFNGYLCGSGIRVYTQADITFTCLSNSISYNEFATWGGRISFPKFGNRGELSPPGPNAVLRIRDYGGTIRYLGEGETTDRPFNFFHLNADKMCTMDAGVTGGVTFLGTFATDRTDRWNVLCLTGSNTVPMTVAGTVRQSAPVTILKDGPGTWYFKDTSNNAEARQQQGIYEVQDGVLQFDSIANLGVACSLGPQTKLVPRTNPLYDISNVVETAFLMGGTAGKTGTLRYVGASAASTDRPVGVIGKGRLENASDAALNWTGGACATGSAGQSAELILAGETVDNAISNLRDGSDGKPLNVTKEGTGKWTLEGDTTFSGKLKVKSGTVAVGKTKNAFTWYKWTIRESSAGRLQRTGATMGDPNVGARQIRFYDEKGNVLPMTEFTEDFACNVAALQPNGMTYDGDVIATRYSTGNTATESGDTGRNLNRLVDDKGTEWLVATRVSPTRIDKPTSWFSVVFRFPEGTPQAAAYDVVAHTAGAYRSACAWTMYGSCDGLTWYELDQQDINPVCAGWMSNGAAFVAGQTAASSGQGFSLADDEDTSVYGLPNASVEVAPGASLVSSRPELKLPLPTPLTVEPGKSYGRYAGFAVPKEGMINISVPLSWFRVTVLETTGGKLVREGGTAGDQNVQMQEFALYDAAGVRRNVGLKVDTRCQPANLEPGFVTYSRSGYNYYGNRDADKLFDDRVAESGWCVVYGNKLVRRDDPSSWIQLTMRLADEDLAIASYDWCSIYEATHVRTVLSWRLEGSADGQNWVTLDEKLDYANRPQGKWWSDGTSLVTGQLRTGFPLSPESMTGLVSLRDLSWSINLSDCTDTANLSKWKVCVNGVEVPKAQMLYTDGVLRAISPGFLITIR